MPRLSILRGPGVFKLAVSLLHDEAPGKRTPIEFFVASSSFVSDPLRRGTTMEVYLDLLGRHPTRASELGIEGTIVSIRQPMRALNFTPPLPKFTGIYLMNRGDNNKGWMKIGDLLADLCSICWSIADHQCTTCNNKLLCADDALHHGESAADAPHHVQPIQPV